MPARPLLGHHLPGCARQQRVDAVGAPLREVAAYPRVGGAAERKIVEAWLAGISVGLARVGARKFVVILRVIILLVWGVGFWVQGVGMRV